DYPIRSAEIGIGIHFQSRSASKLQNHPAMLDGLREVLMLLLVRADVEVAQGIARIDFHRGAKVRNGLIVSAFINQSSAQAVFRDEISACNLKRMGPQRNAVVPVGELSVGKERKSEEHENGWDS